MAHLNLGDVQGNILHGYKVDVVRQLVVRVADRRAAREFLGLVVSGDDKVPQLTTAARWKDKPDSMLNVGVSATGLLALGVSASSYESFPSEFREGVVARAAKLGDVGDSAPKHWVQSLGNPDDVHLMWSIHAASAAALERVSAQLESAWRHTGAFIITATLDGKNLADDKVHFGYRDSISQPRFRVTDETGETNVFGLEDEQPLSHVGAVLLGHDTSFPGVRWQEPVPAELGRGGTFNAFRVLEQDVAGFEAFLAETVRQHPELDVELVAAKLMGRWRDGTPLILAPNRPDEFRPPPKAADCGPDRNLMGIEAAPMALHLIEPNPHVEDRALHDYREANLNHFDYVKPAEETTYNDDHEGLVCPIGAHIRRANPRGARIVQRSANYTRRLVRRGIPYGDEFDPARPNEGGPRGLLGNFICSSLIAQFESIMYDWVNKGLQDPRITGTNDPVLGANDARTSRFEFSHDGTTYVLRGFPRFIKTAGSAYLFMPSITGVRLLAATETPPSTR